MNYKEESESFISLAVTAAENGALRSPEANADFYVKMAQVYATLYLADGPSYELSEDEEEGVNPFHSSVSPDEAMVMVKELMLDDPDFLAQVRVSMIAHSGQTIFPSDEAESDTKVTTEEGKLTVTRSKNSKRRNKSE